MLLFGNFSLYALIAIGFVLFIGMGWHEYAHAVVADWWGDPTPRSYGRLTPNPVVHINWIGWLMFLLIGFGILGSVPVNPRQMRDPRWGNFWTSFAGPLSNLAQAVVYAVLLRGVSTFTEVTTLDGFRLLYGGSSVGSLNGPVIDFFALLCVVGVLFNILLFVFNLLPFFPLDGWRMILSLLPDRGANWKDLPAGLRRNAAPLAEFLYQPAYKWEQWAQYSQYALLALIFVGLAIPQLNFFGILIGGPTIQITTFLLGA